MRERYYSTSFWNLGSYLVHLGYELIDVEPIPAKPHLFEFYFSDNDRTARQDANRFFSPEGAQVDARGVLEAAVQLRKAVKSYERKQEGR